MPIYEFECHSCGNQFELLRSFSETSAPNCPTCEGDHVERRLGRPAIHFKGSGWYINDSKKAAKSSANGSESAGTEGAKKSEASSDTAKESAKTPAPAPASEAA